MKKTTQVITIDRKPTIQDECGTYKIVDQSGLYWGHWYVGINWCKEKFVAAADPRDGLPY